MNGVELLKDALSSTGRLLPWQLSDLSDADLLVRPVPTANHIAWQLGHLIASERFHVLQQFPTCTMPELPIGFAEAHSAAAATGNRPEDFSSLKSYLSHFELMRSATIQVVSTLADDDLDRPASGAVAGFAPTVGAVLMLVSNHTLLHCGQITVVRRLLGKPVLF